MCKREAEQTRDTEDVADDGGPAERRRSLACETGLTAFGAGLVSIGIPKHHAAQYETAVKNGKLLVVAHGTAADVEHAKQVLNQAQAETTIVHAESAAIVM